MVARRIILSFLLLHIFFGAWAQNYSSADTSYEYPNKGTFYHDRFVGRKTASGEIFDQNKFTAAHWRIKLGTLIMVTNCNSGKQVIVKVNDRCPKRGVIDLSHRAATAIGIRGCQPVTVRILPSGYEAQWARQEAMFDSVKTTYYPPRQPAPPSPKPKATPSTTTPPPQPPVTADRFGGYNLMLGTAASHGEAFTLTQRLPEQYRTRTSIDTLEGSDMLRITLILHQSRTQADQVRRSLKTRFPQARVVVAE